MERDFPSSVSLPAAVEAQLRPEKPNASLRQVVVKLPATLTVGREEIAMLDRLLGQEIAAIFDGE